MAKLRHRDGVDAATSKASSVDAATAKVDQPSPSTPPWRKPQQPSFAPPEHLVPAMPTMPTMPTMQPTVAQPTAHAPATPAVVQPNQMELCLLHLQEMAMSGAAVFICCRCYVDAPLPPRPAPWTMPPPQGGTCDACGGEGKPGWTVHNTAGNIAHRSREEIASKDSSEGSGSLGHSYEGSSLGDSYGSSSPSSQEERRARIQASVPCLVCGDLTPFRCAHCGAPVCCGLCTTQHGCTRPDAAG